MNTANNSTQPQLIPARIADALYDDLWLPEEALSVRKLVRDFVEREVRPVAHELNNTPESLEAFPRELVGKMGEAGLPGLPFEQCYGGAGLQYPALATMVMLEEVAYVSSGLAAAMVDVQLILFGHTLKHARDSVKDLLFPALCRGEIVGAFATSEPAASTDLSVRALETTARADAGGYRLSGRKRWITNAPVADYMFVLCKLDAGLTMLLVDMSSAGVRQAAGPVPALAVPLSRLRHPTGERPQPVHQGGTQRGPGTAQYPDRGGHGQTGRQQPGGGCRPRRYPGLRGLRFRQGTGRHR